MTTTLTPPVVSLQDAPPRRIFWAIAIWAAIIIAAIVWGRSLPHPSLYLRGFPPLYSGLRDHLLVLKLLPAAAVGVALAIALPTLSATLSWRRLLVVAWVASLGWTLSVNAVGGWHGLVQPLTTSAEYLAGLPAIGSMHDYLQHFADRLQHYPIHVKGHGPLAVLSFWFLTKIGLSQPGFAAAMVIAIGTSSVVAIAVTVRVIVGEPAARRALPFLVLLPATIWIATTADAMFLGVSAWGVALLALSTTYPRRGNAWIAAVGSGVLFGAALYMSYGLLVLAPLPIAVLVLRRRLSLALPAVIGVGAVAVFFTAEGFSYVAGFHATHQAWAAGIGPIRSRPYFLVGDLGDLAIGIGPVAAIGMARLRDRRLAVLVGSVLVAVAASDLSGFVRGEAERIWLPFMPWLLVAAADIELSKRQTAVLLATQVLLALVVQSVTVSPW